MSTRETQRYRLLIEQLLEEEGGEESRGATARVAHRLGVTGPYVSMVRRGARGAGRDALTKAMRALGLASTFFHEAGIGSGPYYRDYLRGVGSPEAESDPAFWAEFLERYDHLSELTAEELSAMKRFAGRTHRINSWYDWVQLAEWLRNRQPSPTFEGLEDD